MANQIAAATFGRQGTRWGDDVKALDRVHKHQTERWKGLCFAVDYIVVAVDGAFSHEREGEENCEWLAACSWFSFKLVIRSVHLFHPVSLSFPQVVDRRKSRTSA